MPWQGWLGVDLGLVLVSLAGGVVVGLRLWREVRATSRAVRAAAAALTTATGRLQAGLDGVSAQSDGHRLTGRHARR